MIGVSLLGSTGSIGQSALAVLDRHRDRFRVVALAAHRNAAELATQCERFEPAMCTLVDPVAGNGIAPSWLKGSEGLLAAATHPDADVVLNAVVGAAGLQATLAVLQAGKRLALANKESLVAGGDLVMQTLRSGGGEMVPVDSEHSAILQCLRGAESKEIKRLILTASGGPFRGHSAAQLAEVTKSDALRHPTWDMGAKITIDSATLANKALEVIEAHYLFGIDYDRIDVVVHPQSIIHSMVEFVDGSVLAQMGFPTMELPILYALAHPHRIEDHGTRTFDPVAAGNLTFEPLDQSRFRAFSLGIQAGRTAGTAPAVYNAANEVAVAAFLNGEVSFPMIADVIESALEAHEPGKADSLEAVLAADAEARAKARQAIEQIQGSWQA